MTAVALQPSFEKQNIQRCFSGASSSYDSASRLQRVTGRKLFESNSTLFFGNILDLGCGTGVNSKLLFEQADFVAGCDLAMDMAQKSHVTNDGKLGCIQGDATQLPFLANSFDAVYSNLMLQWIDDLAVPLKQIHRTLKLGGHLCFTTLLDRTLHELKHAWSKVDSDQHVNDFKSLIQLQAALDAAGFEYEITVETVVLDYRNVTHLAKELKHLGASYVKNRVTKGLTGRQKWSTLAENYPNDGRGGVPATYQVAYIRAKKA